MSSSRGRNESWPTILKETKDGWLNRMGIGSLFIKLGVSLFAFSKAPQIEAVPRASQRQLHCSR